MNEDLVAVGCFAFLMFLVETHKVQAHLRCRLRPLVPVDPRVLWRKRRTRSQQSDAHSGGHVARRHRRGGAAGAKQPRGERHARQRRHDGGLRRAAARARAGVLRVDEDGRAVLRLLVSDQQPGERVEQVVADGAPHRPRAVRRVVPGLRQPKQGVRGEAQADTARREALPQLLHLDSADGGDALAGEPLEEDNLVEPVDELGREGVRDRLEHFGPRLGGGGPLRQRRERLCAQVGRHDDDRVAEVDRLALRVGEAALVEDLQQQRRNLAVRLLELVEEQHRVRPPPHRLGQLAALVVPDVAGRRADEARDGVLLAELGHVEPRDRVGRVEEELGKRLAKVRLAHAGRPDQHEGAERALGRLQPGARDSHRVRHDGERLVLPDDGPRERRLHLQQLLPLARNKPRRRDAGRARHDFGDMRLRHLLRQERGVGVARLGALAARAAARGLAPLRELLFEPRDDRVRQLARAHQVAVPLRHGKVGARLLQARARRLALLERLPLRAPRGAQLLRRRLLGVQQPADLAPPRRDVHARLAPQRLELDLQVEHLRKGTDGGCARPPHLAPAPQRLRASRSRSAIGSGLDSCCSRSRLAASSRRPMAFN
mmetsp:Transcript_20376/g.61091  ORF Transcript_20376/g.61091 Transcript_20376/m.61091 type:complete len:602 (+) Transcript_20376:2450-4255(+)